jgi:hypothetical protein
MKVEVISDTDCPNVPEARAQLLRAFAEVGIFPSWIEWNRDSTAAPIYARAFGSPTVLVNGQDVSEGAPMSGKACCRLYPDASGTLRGAPSVEQIVVALKACLLDSRSTPLSHAAPEEIDPETGGSIATLSQILLEQDPKPRSHYPQCGRPW